MSTLQGKQPKDTYRGLIKTADNLEVNAEKDLEDGAGNGLPLSISPTAVGFTGDVKDNNGSVGVNGQVLSKTGSGVVWSDRTFKFNQVVSIATWNINHNLGFFPSVSVVDSVGNFVTGDVSYIDDNNITITFKSAFKGKAYLN